MSVYKYLMRGVAKREPGTSQQCTLTGQEATSTNWNAGNSA